MEFLIFMVLLYFLPTILAIVRHPTHDPFGIFLANIFAGGDALAMLQEAWRRMEQA